MNKFKASIVAFGIAAAVALAGCARRDAPATISTQQLMTELGRGQVADMTGDRVTIASGLTGSRLVLVHGRTVDGSLCWLVDPSSTAPAKLLRRIVQPKGCTAPPTPTAPGIMRQLGGDGSVDFVGRLVSLSPPHDGVVSLQLVVNPEPSAAGGAAVTIPVTAGEAEIIARGLRAGVPEVEIRASVNDAVIYPYSR